MNDNQMAYVHAMYDEMNKHRKEYYKQEISSPNAIMYYLQLIADLEDRVLEFIKLHDGETNV